MSEEAAALETIKEVGSGGNFLLEDDTIELMHDAWYPKYTDWNRDAEAIGKDYEYVLKRANAEWKRRLEEAPETMLDTETEKALNAYVEAHWK